jgi:outer membrane protein
MKQGFSVQFSAALVATWLMMVPAQAETISMTRDDMLKYVEQLVAAGKFDEAKPYIAAMEKDPQLEAETALLKGLEANNAHDWKGAEKNFRSVLNQKPKWTRARLELARALYNKGDRQAADYHFQLAQTDQLPPDIARVVQGYRQSIRSQKSWRFNVQLGLAPDTNINSATSDRTIDFGDFGALPLSEDARRKTGLGQTAAMSGNARLRLSEVYALDVEASARLTNYSGRTYDDFTLSPALGLSRDFGDSSRISFAALYSQRWYGGAQAQRSAGLRLKAQHVLGSGGQVQAELSARKVNNLLSDDYSGAQYSLSLAYDQALSKTTYASMSAFAVREPLRNSFYANVSSGLSAGVGSELPWGFNGGLTLSAARTWYDAPTTAFAARRDWTLQGYAYLGLRSLRYLGFSPSVEYRFTRNASNLQLYDFTRHRFEFALASYF